MSPNDLLDQFLIEAREGVEQISQRLLELEKHPADADALNELFRLVHTLKGNCGLFEFKALERVVHAGEDLLERVRSGALAYSGEMADALLAMLDFSAQMIDQIADQHDTTPATEAASHEVANRLRALREGSAPTEGAPPPAADHPPQPAPPPPWLAQLPAQVRHAHPQAVAWHYTPEATCFFKGEDPWLLAKQTPGLVHLTIGQQAPWPAPQQSDCYDCKLAFVGLSDAPLAYVQAHFRCVSEQVALHLCERPQAPAPAPSQACEAAPAQATLHRRAAQVWQDQLTLLARPGLSSGARHASRKALSGLLSALGETAAEAAQTLASLPPDAPAEALRRWATQHAASLDLSLDSPASLHVTDGAAGPGGNASGASPGDEGHQPPKVLKVNQEKVDRLMDLIGEMVVAKNALPYLAQRAEAVYQQRDLAREIKAQYAVINRIAEDMQHAIMQVRMMPVGVVFQRFGRLVRDTAKKLGKEVQLTMEGQDTEADKNIIEALADPLVHILRNSLDHGIERPDVRLAAGKPALGTIHVKACQASDRVVIEIHDDGAGVNAQRVRDKAIERGLIPADKASTLSDADAVQLVFLPGFSTAEAVSDLSGRGVGMDVVRTAVERVNGQVTLSSQAGQGTSLTLSLPLSMAVTNVMIVEAGGTRFGVPMDLIVETVRVHAQDIHHFKQARTTVLRGRIVALRALHELLALDSIPSCNEDGEHAVLVVRMGSESVGLLVDHFHGATDIILKPMDGILAGMGGFAGTALMGDGSVLMVLNPKELV